LRRVGSSGKVAAEDQLRSSLRRDAHRLLFPLGVLLGGLGVLPWLFFALGLTEIYRPIFHSLVFRSMFHPLAETEGFLACFAVGFLFALLPRRTATAPAAWWQVGVALVAPTVIVLCASLQQWELGQIAWILLVGVATEFFLRRIRPVRGWPGLSLSLIWAGAALVAGVAGAALAALGQRSSPERFWVHEVGRTLLTQGLFTGLALATARLVLPFREGVARPGNLWALALHALGSAIFLMSFWIGPLVSFRLGYALRAMVTLAVVRGLARSSQPPDALDVQGRGARVALWMLPVGNIWVVLAPASRRAGMHIIYLGCFALLVLIAAASVSPSAGESAGGRLAVKLAQLGAGGACLAFATAARILVEADPPHFKLWLGAACASFLGATLFTLRGLPSTPQSAPSP
jgi:hypothetical protein